MHQTHTTKQAGQAHFREDWTNTCTKHTPPSKLDRLTSERTGPTHAPNTHHQASWTGSLQRGRDQHMHQTHTTKQAGQAHFREDETNTCTKHTPPSKLDRLTSERMTPTHAPNTHHQASWTGSLQRGLDQHMHQTHTTKQAGQAHFREDETNTCTKHTPPSKLDRLTSERMTPTHAPNTHHQASWTGSLQRG